MSIPAELENVLTSTPDTLGGSVRFIDSRVPLRALFDALTCGRSVDYFLEAYPGITREQVEAVVKWQQNQARKSFGLDLVA